MTAVLTVGNLRKVIKDLPANTVVIIGDDDELNGVHNAWFAQVEPVTNLTKRVVPHLMYHGDIMHDPEEPGFEFNVYLGNNETSKRKVLVIS